MTNVLSVDLKGRVEGGASIEFLRAEVNGASATPFALIRYALDGVEQPEGLRIDLDKRAIIDRLGKPEVDAIIERAAPEIAEAITPLVNQRELLSVLTDSRGDIDAISKAVLMLMYEGFGAGNIAERSGLPEEEIRAAWAHAMSRLSASLEADQLPQHARRFAAMLDVLPTRGVP